MLYVRPTNRTEAEANIKAWNEEHGRVSNALAQARANIARLEEEEQVAMRYIHQARDDADALPPDDNPALLESARRNAYNAVFGAATRRI